MCRDTALGPPWWRERVKRRAGERQELAREVEQETKRRRASRQWHDPSWAIDQYQSSSSACIPFPVEVKLASSRLCDMTPTSPGAEGDEKRQRSLNEVLL